MGGNEAQFLRGIEDARATTNLAEQLTSEEIAELTGKDLMAIGDADYHRGWDYAVHLARKHAEDV